MIVPISESTASPKRPEPPQVPTQETPEAYPGGPPAMLLETLMHELSNPAQAARSSLNLLQAELAADERARLRIQSLDQAFERIAGVLRSVQLAKDAAFIAPAAVTAEELINNCDHELRALGIRPTLKTLSNSAPPFLLPVAIISVLLACWAASESVSTHTPLLQISPQDSHWALTLTLRPAATDAHSCPTDIAHAAGYPAAIGEYMRASGGNAALRADDQGHVEMCLLLPVTTKRMNP